MAMRVGDDIYYTTAEIAEQIDVTQATISKWCRTVSEENRPGLHGLEEGRNFFLIRKRWYLTEKWLNNYLKGRFDT